MYTSSCRLIQYLFCDYVHSVLSYYIYSLHLVTQLLFSCECISAHAHLNDNKSEGNSMWKNKSKVSFWVPVSVSE